MNLEELRKLNYIIPNISIIDITTEHIVTVL